MKLKEWMISQEKNEALADRSSGTQNTYRYLLEHIEAVPGYAADLPHFFLGYEAAILYRVSGSQGWNYLSRS